MGRVPGVHTRKMDAPGHVPFHSPSQSNLLQRLLWERGRTYSIVFIGLDGTEDLPIWNLSSESTERQKIHLVFCISQFFQNFV